MTIFCSGAMVYNSLKAAEKLDEERYETIYADPDKKESVAAPTAGMHFDQELLNTLEQNGVEFGYVNLHVGAGTFQPVKTDNIEDLDPDTLYFIVKIHFKFYIRCFVWSLFH